MIKPRKKYKELNMLVKIKYKSIYDYTSTFLVQKSYNNGEKNT